MKHLHMPIKRAVLSNLLIIFGILLLIYSFIPFIGSEVWYGFLRLSDKHYEIEAKDSGAPASSVFGDLLTKASIGITPVNSQFSLVIEKIGLNVPVVMGVSVTDPAKYNEALKNGVAHALVSDLPSKNPGNVYLFAHTSFNFWSLGKYATAFNLLRKLEIGDKVNVFFNGKRYEYAVVNKEILPGWNTYPLTRSVLEPLLTMQTCDPPGTTLNRLIVTSKLNKVFD